jgi:hypothetical protein
LTLLGLTVLQRLQRLGLVAVGLRHQIGGDEPGSAAPFAVLLRG